jgi:hypothetical protein
VFCGPGALDQFVVYLARAHECDAIVSVSVERSRHLRYSCIEPRDPRLREQGIWELARGEPAELAGRSLLAVRLAHDEATCRAALVALAPSFGRACASVIVVADRRSPCDLPAALASAGLEPAFVGRAPGGGASLAILDNAAAAAPRSLAPPAFRVLAIVPTYNEEDIIAQTLRDIIDQGLEPYVIDNRSSDRTIARAYEVQGLAGLETFPLYGASRTSDLLSLLLRVEEIAATHPWASWVMLHDADERRRSPWPGVRLRDALWHVDRSGYSCIDHVTMNFWPIDDTFDPATHDLEQHFGWFELSDHPGHFHQRRAWKQLGMRVLLAPNGGHDVAFPGRRLYPYRFLLKHYPLRSRAHGERKLRERRMRENAQERAWGWHRQYDRVGTQHVLRDPRTLNRFEPDRFFDEYLVERLSAAGIFVLPPPWATEPTW